MTVFKTIGELPELSPVPLTAEVPVWSQNATYRASLSAVLSGGPIFLSPLGSAELDSLALQAALTAGSAARRRIVALAGEYLYDRKVSLPDGSFLDLELQAGANFDFSPTVIPNRDSCFEVGTDTGGLTALPVLSVDALKNTETVTLDSAPNVSAGDLVIISDSTDSSFNPSIIDRAYYKNGEYKRVHSVSGNSIRFDVPLYDTYLAANPNITLYKVTTNYVHIHGQGKIIAPGIDVGGNGGDVGLMIWNAYRSTLSGIRVENAKFSNINVWRCFDTVIENVHTLTEDTQGNGSAGGFMLSSYNTWIRGGTHQGSKHGWSLTGGAVMASIPNRLCGGSNTTMRGTLTAADMHGHNDRCQWLNCTIEGGASIGGSNCAIIGGSVRSASDSYNVGTLRGMCIRIREAKSSGHTVNDVDCYLDHPGFQDSEGYPFSFDIYEAVEAGTFHVRNLRIRSSVYNPKLVLLRAVGRAVTFIKPSFVFEDVHHFDATGGKTPILAIECLDDGGTAAFDKVVIARTSGLSPQTTNVRCKELTCDGVVVENSDSFGIVAAVVAYSGVTQFINVLNCRTSLNDASGIFVAAAAAAEDVYCTIRGCKSLNNGQDGAVSAASKSSVRATLLKLLELSDNIFGDTQSVQTQGILYSVTSTTTLIGSGNKALGATLLRSASPTNDLEELTFVGTGTPEGAVTAPVGSLFIRKNGGAGTTRYFKESGTGNTGWVAK